MDGIITLAQAQRLDKMLRGAIWSSGEGTNSYRFPEGLLSYLEQQTCQECKGKGDVLVAPAPSGCYSCSGTGRRSPWPLLVYYEGFGAMKLLLAYSRPEGNFLPASTVLQALEVCQVVFGGHLRLFDDPGPNRWWFTIYKDSMLVGIPSSSISTKTWGPCDSAEDLLDALLGTHS